MAMQINADECISCGSCEFECPTSSISSGLVAYKINASTCTECEGEYSSPNCVGACPIDECITQIAD